MALKASACKSGQKMTQKEFTDLLFSNDEKLDVDLNAIVAPSSEEKIKAFERIQLMKQPVRLDLDALEQGQKDQFRQRQHWRDLLKKQIREITKEVQMSDSDKSFTVDPALLMKVINKRIENVPHQLRDHVDMLYDYVGEFRDDASGRIHYRALANDLQSFNFD